MSCVTIVIETQEICCIREDEGVRLKYCQCLCKSDEEYIDALQDTTRDLVT